MRNTAHLSTRNAVVRSLTCLAAIITLAVLAMPAWSSCSGLLLIPTADIVEHGEYCVDAEVDWAFGGGYSAFILNTEFGLTPRLEAGLDFDFSSGAESTLLLNAKYLIISESERTPAIAVGIQSVGRNLRSSLFAAAMKDFGFGRGHAGLVDVDGRARWFIGADTTLGEKLDVFADYTNGDENYSSVGATYALTESTSVTGGAMFPNSGGDTLFTLQYSFSGSYGNWFRKR